MKSSHLAVVGVLTPLLSLATAQITQASGNCTIFNWNQQPGYLTNGTTTRVSGALTCPPQQNETYNCPITATGDQQATFSYQANPPLRDSYWNTNEGSQSFLHNLVLSAVNSSLQGVEWPDYAIGIIDTVQTLEPGTSGYINFTSLIRCFEGTMSGCTGNLTDGVELRACAPVALPIRGARTLPILEGSYTVVEIPEDTVDQFRDPFSGQLRGEGENGVGRMKSGFTSVVIGAALTLAMIWL